MAKSRINVTIDTTKTGPLFDGGATKALYAWLDATKIAVAERGIDVLIERALKMDKSERSTGHYATTFRRASVNSYNDQLITDGGIIYGPWLEGDSKRNQKSRFKGYHQFRRTRQQLQAEAKPIAQAQLDRYIVEMGGYTE